MTEAEYGYADLELMRDSNSWSLNARVSEQAMYIADVRKSHCLPADESLLPSETEYDIPILSKNTLNADDEEKAATLVDYVDAFSTSISYFDLQTNKIIASGKILNLGISSSRAGDGVRLGMYGMIKRPEGLSDEKISAVATTAMRSVAIDIGYANPDGKLKRNKYKAFINDLVWTSYDSERGVTITTNPLGSCSLDTDGNQYDPASEMIELHQHNIYTHTQQLLCLVGLVAVANAETLVKKYDL